MAEDASKALWGKCEDCGHIWAAGYYPIDLAQLAKIVGQHSTCPKCGGRGRVAKQNDGELLEEPR